MRKFFAFAIAVLFSIGSFATDYAALTAGTYDVGAAENPGGANQFSSYALQGIYLFQAPSGHSYSKGSGPATGIYTIYSESGLVFHNSAKMNLTIGLDVQVFAANEDISVTLYSISAEEYETISTGNEQSDVVPLNSKDVYETGTITVTSMGAFQGEITDLPAGFYYIVCSSTNVSNIVWFNQITFAAAKGGEQPGEDPQPGDDPQPKKKIKVHTIGDSTMAEYDESTTDKRGWGMYLGSFFNPDFVTVNNRGKSGADTRQFYTNANLWPSVKSQMSAGDYLIIQFAHNDEGTVTYGMDNLEYRAYCEANGLTVPTDARGTNPQTTYRDFLRTFIDEARALGVNPVLVGPICRRYFNGNTIKRNGQHDLGDNFSKIENGVLYTNQSVPADDHSMDYVYAMQVVAQEKNVPFVNLTTATRDLYLSYGDQQSKDLLFCAGDNTHTNTMGANLIARQAAQMLKDAEILAEYIDIPTSITASPNAIDLGEVYTGVERSSEVLLTGFGLEPASGTVTISASANLTVSTDNQTFGESAQASYVGSTLFQRVYIHASYTAEGSQLDSLVITSGDKRIVVPVSASAMSLEGGTAVSAFWAIDAKPVPDPVVTGPVSAILTMSYLMAADTKSDLIDGDVTNVTMVRFHNADASGAKTAWPGGEIDENATRYLDFAMKAPTNAEVRITGISMDLAAYSTATMCCHINTGFGDDFMDVKTIYERKNFTHQIVEHLSLTPTLTIPAGETLHVRVLPWHDNAESKSGKYICVKNVRIEGQAFEPGDDPREGIDPLTAHPSTLNVTKILRNGQMFIIRNGVIYNAQGAVVQ